MTQRTDCDFCGVTAPPSIYSDNKSGWRFIGISGKDRRGTYTMMHFCPTCKRKIGDPVLTFLHGMGRK